MRAGELLSHRKGDIVISAKVILDSLHPNRINRLTTMEVTFHRFVLAEFNTHRVFSRNSASSRAIPAQKQIDRVMSNPALPVSWPHEQRGMQGGDELDATEKNAAINSWLGARDKAVHYAQELIRAGVHKSVTSRLLEPFMWHTVIVSSTEWDNFFDLRCNSLAQPEIRAVAELMRQALNESTPTVLSYGDWHMPYVTGYDLDEIMSSYDNEPDWQTLNVAKMCSAARCARVSYLTHEGTKDIRKDMSLAARLMNPGEGPMHASAFEHVARPTRVPVGGNFTNFRQWRHDLEMAQAIDNIYK